LKRKRYIICIDDEYFILWNLKEQLKKILGSDFTIETAENADAAREIIDEINKSGEEITVVICDQVMPGQKGDEFLIQLHKTNPNTKKIMLTGQASAEAVGRAVNHGCLYRFISKPWDAFDLDLTIKQAIEAFDKDRSLEERNAELEKSLYYNSQTNFPNFESLIRLTTNPESKDASYSIALIQITNYSSISKSFGVGTYKKIMIRFLEMLSIHLQKSSEIYHLYDDEIAIVSQTPEIKLIEEIETFRLLIKSDDLIVDEVSFRLQTYASSATGREDAYYKAKLALFKAEGSFAKQTIPFSEELSNDHHLQNFQTSQKITKAINEKNIVPFFQAIYDNQSKTIYKYECLARIRDKQGFLSPAVFLEIAKTTGSIRMIGLQMIDSSMSYFSDKTFEFSINLTEAELEYKSFSKWVEARLAFYKINPNRVTFEILEDISFAVNKNSVTTIQELKEIGCMIAIDDFGVQYSNLSRLLEIDPDYIKIDGQFIKVLPTNKTSLLLVQGILDLSHRIGAKVVAEFVSSEQIQEIVVGLGIEYSQGYLFMEPKQTI
jgi:EAL domain-containing protein (putative c-di-GMP-specific phosphodiesterase class I)/FixJ family two-component response regulator